MQPALKTENRLVRLHEDHIREHVRQSHDLWGGGKTEEERYQKLLKMLKGAGPELFYMSGFVDGQGRLLTSLKRYYFDLHIGSRTVRTLGLGAIFTDPALRKAGLASAMIRAAMNEARENEGCGAALLFSDIGTEYYERFGFRSLPAKYWNLDIKAMPEGDGLQTREEPDNMAALIRWYDEATKNYAIRPARTVETFRLFSAINSVSKFLVLSENGRDVGYLSMGAGPGMLWVDEWYAPGIDSKRVWATVRRLAIEHDRVEAKGWWLPWYGIEGQARTRAVPMIALLDSDVRLLEADIANSCFLAATDHF